MEGEKKKKGGRGKYVIIIININNITNIKRLIWKKDMAAWHSKQDKAVPRSINELILAHQHH